MLECPKDSEHKRFYREERVSNVEVWTYDEEMNSIDIQHEKCLEVYPWDGEDLYCTECDTVAIETEG